MITKELVSNPPELPATYRDIWDGPDQGLVVSWLRGLEKRRESPELAARCEAGELPLLPWKGGVERAFKGRRTGSLRYVAMWQGLRGEDLDIDTASEPVMVCAQTGMAVTFTMDLEKLLKEQADGDICP